MEDADRAKALKHDIFTYERHPSQISSHPGCLMFLNTINYTSIKIMSDGGIKSFKGHGSYKSMSTFRRIKVYCILITIFF